MAEKEESLTISFEIDPPNGAGKSMFNTLVLLINEIQAMQENIKTNTEVVVYNSLIEKAKTELDNIKIIQIDGGK